MADDVLISEEIDIAAAVAAIESLQKRGADLNPYSLADELELDHRLIVGNGEVMQMLSYARGDVNGIVAAEYDKLLKRVNELEEFQREHSESAKEDSEEDSEHDAEQDSKQANEQLEKELEDFRRKNNKLVEQVSALENANQVLALSIQDSFGQGSAAKVEELEKAVAAASEESYQKGFDAAKEELQNKADESVLDHWKDGYEKAKKELEEELLQTKEKSWQEGFEAAKSEQGKNDKSAEESWEEGYESARKELEEEHAGAKEQARQEGFDSAKAEVEEAVASAKEKAWQKGYEKAKKELEDEFANLKEQAWQEGYEAAVKESADKNADHDSAQEQWQKGYDAAKLELEETLAQSQQEMWQQGYSAGKQEALESQQSAEPVTAHGAVEVEMMEAVSKEQPAHEQQVVDQQSVAAMADFLVGANSVAVEVDELEPASQELLISDPNVSLQETFEGTLLSEESGEDAQPKWTVDDAQAVTQGHKIPNYLKDMAHELGNDLGAPSDAVEVEPSLEGRFEAYDPAAQAYDPAAQAYDPAAQAYDPAAQAYDPAAQAYDPAAQAYEPAAQAMASRQAYDPAAQAYDPAAQAYDPAAQAYDPAAQAYDPAAQAYDPAAQAPAHFQAAQTDGNNASYSSVPAYDHGGSSSSMPAYDHGGSSSSMPAYDGGGSSASMPAYNGGGSSYQNAPQYDTGVSYTSMPAYDPMADMGTSAEMGNSGGFGDANAVVFDAPDSAENVPVDDGSGSEGESAGQTKSERSKTSEFDPNELRNLVQGRLHKQEDAPAEGEGAKAPTRKFVGGKHQPTQEHNTANMPRVVSPDVRRACKLLGLRPEELLNKAVVIEAWKREMAKPGVHPDTGGDTEMAMYLNNAKDTLVRYLEAQAPKLGKVFGSKTTDHGNKDNPKGDKS